MKKYLFAAIKAALAPLKQHNPERYQRLRVWARRVPIVGPHLLREYLVQRYIRHLGYAPRLDSPRKLTEHITARILYDRDPRLKVLCDKRAVRRYIAQVVGARYVVPLLGQWRTPECIGWDTLPETLVFKPSHSSGPIRLVHDLRQEDRREMIDEMRQWLAQDYYEISSEWGYLGVPRYILAEPMQRAPDGLPLLEVSLFVFGGEMAYARYMVGFKLSPTLADAWFDRQGTRIAVRKKGRPDIEKTMEGDRVAVAMRVLRRYWAELVQIGDRAGAGFSHVRVDVFLTDSGLRIVELTPYGGAGLSRYEPESWNDEAGRLYGEALERFPMSRRPIGSRSRVSAARQVPAG